MLNKISGLARAIYIVLAILAGFVALGGMDVPMVLVVLGLISGLAMTEDRLILAAVLALTLPLMGGALAHLPSVGAQLNAAAGNLQIGVAAALAMGTAIFLYHLVMKGVMGLTAADAPATGRKAAAAR